MATQDWIKRSRVTGEAARRAGAKAGKEVLELGEELAERAREVDLADLPVDVREKAEKLLGRADTLVKRAQEGTPELRERAGRLAGAARGEAEHLASRIGERTPRVTGSVTDAAERGAGAVTVAAGKSAQVVAHGAETAGETARRAVQTASGSAGLAWWLRHLIRPAAFVLGSVLVYRRWGRRWVASWGATAAELQAPLPGDDVVTTPRRVSTRAVTIDAPVAEVWPWLLQLGQGRGGLYSYDWLENLLGCDMHSADTVLPQHQNLAVGDFVRLVPEGYRQDLRFEVAELEPEKALVLKTPGDRLELIERGFPHASWAFVVRPLTPDRTRLLVRWRSDFADTPMSRFANSWGIEIPHFLMERKTLLGVKERAER